MFYYLAFQWLSACQICFRKNDDWMKLFNGTFDNWKVGENAATFKTEDGMIVVNGPWRTCFMMVITAITILEILNLSWISLTTPGSNSGVYIHTKYQKAAGRRWAMKYR